MPLSSVGIGGDSFEVKEDKNVSCLFPSLLAKRVARLSHPMRPARRRRRHWPKCLKYRRGSPVIFTTYLRQCTSAHAARPHPAKSPTCNFEIMRLKRNCSIWNWHVLFKIQECCGINDQACEDRVTLGGGVEGAAAANQPLPGVHPVPWEIFLKNRF